MSDHFDQSDFNDFAHSGGRNITDRPPVTCNNCGAETQGVVEYDENKGMHVWYCDSNKPSCLHRKDGTGLGVPIEVARFDQWEEFFPEDFQKFQSESDFY